MDNKKIRRSYMLLPKTIEKLEEYAKQKNKSLSDMVDELVLEHEELESKVANLEEKERTVWTRIRLASNGADRKAEIILEMLNALSFAVKAPTNTNTIDLPSKLFTHSNEVVKQRIKIRHAKKKSKHKQ